jgi:hypothetical protein
VAPDAGDFGGVPGHVWVRGCVGQGAQERGRGQHGSGEHDEAYGTSGVRSGSTPAGHPSPDYFVPPLLGQGSSGVQPASANCPSLHHARQCPGTTATSHPSR